MAMSRTQIASFLPAALLWLCWSSCALAGAPQEEAVSFELDIVPILTRLGCNAGACHGKARGQNGFQLSLLGFYPDFDYAALTQEARGRRVFPTVPEQSLLLKKAAGLVPHGGGKRMEPGGPYYDLMLRWIAQGLKRAQPGERLLEQISVVPAEGKLTYNDQQPLAVTARYSDGSTRDVTGLAAFQSNESVIASVDAAGVMRTGTLPGEAAVMARYMGRIAVCNVVIPLQGSVPGSLYEQLPRQNFIDGLVWDKLQALAITPSPPAAETTWLRRVFIDIIGRLPEPGDVREFLTDTSSEKRSRVIDRLLERPEYADYWANKWADLLRPNPYRVGVKAVFNYDAWIRDAFRKNKPYDQFVRELITAQGSTWQNGAVTLFRDRREPDEITTIVSQLFLGIRLECAKCHHHPFEKWGQEDFYGFAAYFSRIGHKGTGISPPISGSEEIFFTAKSGFVKHPLTGEDLPPKPLFGAAPAAGPDDDPRQALAQWLTAPENPYFARVIVNRVWADIMGRGLVEPVDDLRATNPPTNGPLLEALARAFVEQKLRSEKTDPHDQHVVCLRPGLVARRSQRRRHPQLLAPLPPATAGRDAARFGLRHHAASRVVRRNARRLACDADVDSSRRIAVSRFVRPSRSQPGSSLRTNRRNDGGASAASHEFARIAQQGDHRFQAGRTPGGRRQASPRDRRRTVFARLLAFADR